VFLIFGVIINYFCGIIYFNYLTGNTFFKSFLVCVLPFVLGDIIKVVIVGLFGERIRRLV